MPTASELIHSSMRLIGAIAAGETLETAELNDGMVTLNQMMASWSAERVTVYEIRRDSFPLTGSQSYTMGPAGAFSATRPTQIVAARASSGNYGRGLRIIDVNRWAEILERGGAVNLPMRAFVDYNSPLATVHLWPVPIAGTLIELYTLQEFTTFPDAIASPNPPPPPMHNFVPQRMTHTLAGGTSSFTIGPGGQLAMPRPARCDAIAASTGTYRGTVQIVSAAEWSTMLEPSGAAITVPMELYVDYGYPAVTLNVWPVPQGGTIEVHSLQALQNFASLTDPVALPPGYEAAIRYNLAVALLPEYPRSEVDPSLMPQAQNYKASLVQLNQQNHTAMQAAPAAAIQ